jgi:hypothetical protein
MGLTIQLTAAVEQRLRAQAQAEGTPVEELAANLLTSVTEPLTLPEEWLDKDYHAECEADISPEVSLEEVRRMLSKIPGSMVPDFIAERDE